MKERLAARQLRSSPSRRWQATWDDHTQRRYMEGREPLNYQSTGSSAPDGL